MLHDFEQQEDRQRKRTVKDRQWLWQVGYALLTDLTYHYLMGSPGNGLVIPRAKSDMGKKYTRYSPPFFTRTFPDLIDDLQRLEYLQQTKGTYSGMPGKSKRTTIKASERLIASVREHGIGFDDLAVSEDEEVIILKRKKTGYDDDGERIEYDDTPVTVKLRNQVRQVNAWLEAADIRFEASAHDRPVDVRARRLFRYFAEESFSLGGRLFRGFWQNLPKPARLRGIIIEGERVIELDYSQLNPTLAYADVGVRPPAGDAYMLPGFEDDREGVKKLFNAMLFDKAPRKSFPKGVKALFPPKTKVADVIGRIREKHPMLKSVLSTGRGYHLMYRESEVMMRVLESLRGQSMVGLPVYDAVIVKRSEAEAAKAVMEREFQKATGLEIQVKLEGA